MTKKEIIHQLTIKHSEIADLISSLNDTDFCYSSDSKWTAGQQLDHIILSVSPLAKALLLPRFILKRLFGKANRPSKDYDSLVKKYVSKLDAGGKAPTPFIPKTVESNQKKKLKSKSLKLVTKLCKQVDGFSEQQLDEYILPHPLLGKVTIREMLYFTIYHAEHHQKITLRNLGR